MNCFPPCIVPSVIWGHSRTDFLFFTVIRLRVVPGIEDRLYSCLKFLRSGAHQSFGVSLLGDVSSFPMRGFADSLWESAVLSSLMCCYSWDFCHHIVFTNMGIAAMKLFCLLQSPADVQRQMITELSAEYGTWGSAVRSTEHRRGERECFHLDFAEHGFSFMS